MVAIVRLIMASLRSVSLDKSSLAIFSIMILFLSQHYWSTVNSRFSYLQKNSLQSKSKTQISALGTLVAIQCTASYTAATYVGSPDICPVNCGYSTEYVVDQWSSDLADRRTEW